MATASHRFRRALTALLVLTISAVALPPAGATPLALQGRLQADGKPVSGATVELVRAGSNPESARVVATAAASDSGAFTFTMPASVRADDVLYLTARGGPLPEQVELAAALGDLRAGNGSSTS